MGTTAMYFSLAEGSMRPEAHTSCWLGRLGAALAWKNGDVWGPARIEPVALSRRGSDAWQALAAMMGLEELPSQL